MADVEYPRSTGAYGRDATPASNRNTLVTTTNMAGAVVSLALIAGVGVWGYKLIVRDVSGIPIVRAVEGDMRVRPDDPGGQLAQNQGLAVNAIAAQGVAAGPVDQVILAPPPIALSDEDTPVPSVQPASELAEAAPLTPETSGQQNEIDALVAELTTGVEPLVQVPGAKTVKAAAVTPEPAIATTEDLSDLPEPQPAVAEVVRVSEPTVAASIRPKLRPQRVPVMAQPASYTPARATAEINADDIPSGTRLVQLGAFASPEIARQEWARLDVRFGVYLQDKSRVIQKAQSNGRTFYRLRAMGFVDLNDARQFCSAFKAEGADCIPVQVR